MSGEHPVPRRWCGFAATKMGGVDGLLVYGGNWKLGIPLVMMGQTICSSSLRSLT